MWSAKLYTVLFRWRRQASIENWIRVCSARSDRYWWLAVKTCANYAISGPDDVRRALAW